MDLPDYLRLAMTIRPDLERVLTPDQARRCLSLVSTSALQLSSATAGSRLYEKARTPEQFKMLYALGEDRTTIEVLATNTVPRCAVTALDLCAAVAAVVAGMQHPNFDQEFDVGMLKERKWRKQLRAQPGLQAWFNSLVESQDWTDLQVLRDEVTHRRWHRQVYAQAGSMGDAPSDEPVRAFTGVVKIRLSSGKEEDLLTLLPRLSVFADRAWRAFLGQFPMLT